VQTVGIDYTWNPDLPCRGTDMCYLSNTKKNNELMLLLIFG